MDAYDVEGYHLLSCVAAFAALPVTELGRRPLVFQLNGVLIDPATDAALTKDSSRIWCRTTVSDWNGSVLRGSPDIVEVLGSSFIC